MLRLLTPSESSLIQPIFDACADYALMQDGQPFAKNAAELEFDDVPIGFSKEAKRIFAIEGHLGQPVGVIEGLRGYPNFGIWFIGLMLLVPEARSTGVGTLALEALERYVQSADNCSELELAVLKANTRALRFWEVRGFYQRREAPAVRFGHRTHERWVLGKRLREGEDGWG